MTFDIKYLSIIFESLICCCAFDMDGLLNDGWFSEKNPLWPGQYFSLEVDSVLHTETSKFQEIAVIQTKKYGRALVLDGIIQCTERDEFSYQEMMALVPLCAHPNPSRVLIVGGGDGGVAREVAKHPLVKEIYQVEIDDRVVQLSKQFLPHMAVGFQSPKLKLIIGDGFEFMRNHNNEFDVIITDSSDPVGPNASLFQEGYFQLLKQALRPGGIACSQASTAWIDLEQVTDFARACKKHFSVVKYGITSVPTYPTGQIGFLIGANEDPSIARFKFSEEQLEHLKINYYDAEVHAASFVLPRFVRKQFDNI